MTEAQVQKVKAQLDFIRHAYRRFEKVKGFNTENCKVNGKIDLLAFVKEALKFISPDGLREFESKLQSIEGCDIYSASMQRMVKERIAELERGDIDGESRTEDV